MNISFDTWFGIGLGGGYFVNPKLAAMLAQHGIGGGTSTPARANVPRAARGRAVNVERLRAGQRTRRTTATRAWTGDPALLNRIVTLTRTADGIGKGELVTKLGVTPNVAERALGYLRKAGKIQVRGKNRFARWYAAA